MYLGEDQLIHFCDCFWLGPPRRTNELPASAYAAVKKGKHMTSRGIHL